jgi:YHS domain-containing protein
MPSVTDPVCGMSIDPTTAAGTSSYAGQVYYFCSVECKREFDSNPQKYLSESSQVATAERADDPPHTKTGPIVAPKFGSAGSGGLEYEPLPGDTRD